MKKDQNGNALGGFKAPKAAGSASNGADWMDCDGKELQKAIAAASFKHGALRFGYSRDGFAYAVGIYIGEQRITEYIRPSEDIDNYLRLLTTAFEEYDADSEITPQRKRT